ncbi:Flp family type IVb pilin [Vibrio sp. 16]|uniref:Flp family type IVb pilin n=1 Tax=Vibrio sp. 16 TaxID=391586 RepID=UPI002FF1A8F4
MFNRVYSQLKLLFTEFRDDQRGVTTIEYVLILSVVAIMIISIFVTDTELQSSLINLFKRLTNTIDSV